MTEQRPLGRRVRVSVQTVAEVPTAREHPGVGGVQVILDTVRRKPREELRPAAARAGVGILARVPPADGLLTGGYDTSTTFADNHQRDDNRNGRVYDERIRAHVHDRW